MSSPFRTIPPPSSGCAGRSMRHGKLTARVFRRGKNEARLVPGPGFDYGAGHEGRTRDIYLGKANEAPPPDPEASGVVGRPSGINEIRSPDVAPDPIRSEPEGSGKDVSN